MLWLPFIISSSCAWQTPHLQVVPATTAVTASISFPILTRHLYVPLFTAMMSLNISWLLSVLIRGLPSVDTALSSGPIHTIVDERPKPSPRLVVQFRILASPHPSAGDCRNSTSTSGAGRPADYRRKVNTIQPKSYHWTKILPWTVIGRWFSADDRGTITKLSDDVTIAEQLYVPASPKLIELILIVIWNVFEEVDAKLLLTEIRTSSPSCSWIPFLSQYPCTITGVSTAGWIATMQVNVGLRPIKKVILSPGELEMVTNGNGTEGKTHKPHLLL